MGYLIPTPPHMRKLVPHCENIIRTHSHDIVDGVEVCPYPPKVKPYFTFKRLKALICRVIAYLLP